MKQKLSFLLIIFIWACQTPAPSGGTNDPEPPTAQDGPLPPMAVTESPLPTAEEKTGRTFELGTNIKEIRDYGREIPFVDLMHSARTWYTKGTGSSAWNTEQADKLTYRADGYPTHIPQTVSGLTDTQKVATIWADVSSWPLGTYTVLWDGTGTLKFGGNISDVQQVDSHRLTFSLNKGDGTWDPSVEVVIETSEVADPLHNIRVIMPGHLESYAEKPFNPLWLEGLRIFKSIRFMDWGETNSWNFNNRWKLSPDQVFTWADRAQMDYYTWADGRGVPYEMMIRLMNEEGFDGWVCVPDRVDQDFITRMAVLFRDNLESDRHLTVEYSNEIWNFIMDQQKFLEQNGYPSPYAVANHQSDPSKYPHDPATVWPEKITGNLQDCLRIWTEVFTGKMNRITRVIGLQGAWLDVSQRMAFNVDPQYYDALTQGWYFSLGEAADKALDQWGSRATVDVVAKWTRYGRFVGDKSWINQTLEKVAAPLNKPMVWYEGGNHMTPIPFGEKPSYSQALEAIHRAPVMKEMYLEWFAFMKSLKSGDEPMKLMHFSYIADLSAQYGSWGIFETLGQDTSKVPAPKYEALLEALTW